MDQIKKEIKENISILIEKGLYERANQIIEKYEAMAYLNLNSLKTLY